MPEMLQYLASRLLWPKDALSEVAQDCSHHGSFGALHLPVSIVKHAQKVLFTVIGKSGNNNH